ncbi:MAG: phosphoadenylyl-sulfate reductase [Microthrixaceae bacterium]|nr:phosphoadenylyl-sulfate reductase [Microthrixaceae bacterium]
MLKEPSMSIPVGTPAELNLSDGELAEFSTSMERWTAAEIISWAVASFGPKICVAASMGDTVLVHLATQVAPDIEVVFLDTGFHFAETIVTLRAAQSRYGLNLRVERPDVSAPDLFNDSVEECCAARKVAPLERALESQDAWITGLRRSESVERSTTPILGRDRRGKIKVCPIATWSEADVEGYVADNDLVVNPLLAQGYPSIGCWPCTKRVAPGEDLRSGRWSESDKTECGLHL